MALKMITDWRILFFLEVKANIFISTILVRKNTILRLIDNAKLAKKLKSLMKLISTNPLRLFWDGLINVAPAVKHTTKNDGPNIKNKNAMNNNILIGLLIYLVI